MMCSKIIIKLKYMAFHLDWLTWCGVEEWKHFQVIYFKTYETNRDLIWWYNLSFSCSKPGISGIMQVLHLRLLLFHGLFRKSMENASPIWMRGPGGFKACWNICHMLYGHANPYSGLFQNKINTNFLYEKFSPQGTLYNFSRTVVCKLYTYVF